jgi:ABC-type phosphate/phosphonate transport system permease subunit
MLVSIALLSVSEKSEALIALQTRRVINALRVTDYGVSYVLVDANVSASGISIPFHVYTTKFCLVTKFTSDLMIYFVHLKKWNKGKD